MKKIFLSALAITLLLTGCGSSSNPSSIIKSSERKIAPKLFGATLDGGTYEVQLGKVTVINVWASWCVACREEHPVLVELAKSGIAPVIGLDYKDKREDALTMLQRQGDPYMLSAFDANGRVGIDYGVYGVPETYIIDQAGVIRFKHIGPITMQVLNEKMYPLIRELKKS